MSWRRCPNRWSGSILLPTCVRFRPRWDGNFRLYISQRILIGFFHLKRRPSIMLLIYFSNVLMAKNGCNNKSYIACFRANKFYFDAWLTCRSQASIWIPYMHRYSTVYDVLYVWFWKTGINDENSDFGELDNF